MRLASKLTLLLSAASVVPLILATSVTVPSSAAALRLQLSSAHRASAESLARQVDDLIDAKLDDIRFGADAVLLPDMDDDARAAALELIYEQTRGANAVGLFDEHGREVTPSAYFTELSGEAAAVHEPMRPQDLAAFAQGTPLGAVLETGSAVVGPPYVVETDSGELRARVVLAVPVRGSAGAAWVLAVEVSLAPLTQRFLGFASGEAVSASLMDARGRAIVHPDAAVMRARAEIPEAARAADGAEWLGSSATSRRTAWVASVRQPAEIALAPVRRQAEIATVAVILALALAGAVGFSTVRAVTRPLGRLREAATRVAQGDLATEVGLTGRDELAELGAAFDQMTRGLRERERLKGTLSRYVSGEIAARILREEDDLNVAGELVEVTVLFVDIRGFSTLAEKHPPAEVVELLNGIFERVVAMIEQHDGVVNKFIGDSVMALFGVPRAVEAPELKAVEAALDVQRAVAELMGTRRARGAVTAAIGIGVNTGEAIAGNIGSSRRLEYTVTGDAVNVAERLQSQASGGQVLISAVTASRLADRFELESRGAVTVKGRREQVEVFRVLGAGRGAKRVS